MWEFEPALQIIETYFDLLSQIKPHTIKVTSLIDAMWESIINIMFCKVEMLLHVIILTFDYVVDSEIITKSLNHSC